MALGQLTPSAVERAIREFDQLGRDEFLTTYGFGHATDYVIERDGREYDSKAIAGVAYGFDHPDDGPLPSSAFSGGEETIRALEGAGYTVTRKNGASADSVQRLLERVLATYREARTGPFGREAPVWQDFEALGETLGSSPGVAKRPTVRTRWSVGRGNWATVPWVAFLDSRETDTTQHGTYAVLLFREDMTGVYVTVAQGVTEPMSRGRAAGLQTLQRVADEVRSSSPGLADAGFALNSDIDLRTQSTLGRNYELSTVAHKFYARGNVPPDDQIFTDVDAAVAAVDQYVSDRGEPPPTTGQAVVAVYVGQQGERNLQVALDNGVWGWKRNQPSVAELPSGTPILMGSGYSGGSPRVGAGAWRQHELERVIRARTTGRMYEDASPLWPDEGPGVSYRYRLPIEVLEEVEDLDLDGPAVSPELADAFRRSALDRGHGIVIFDDTSPIVSGDTPQPVETLKSVAARFRSAVDGSGLSIPTGHGDQLLALLAALITKPFVILSGLSGSGKTQLALRLGEWFGHGPDLRRFLAVPVRPDWTGPEPLFGYEDALRAPKDGRAAWFVPDTLRFLLAAGRDPAMPYLLLLDEMNLAHVERYFSDFLSGLESREPVVPNLVRDEGGEWRPVESGPESLPVPRNVFVVGTVNVDETTYLFSPKVLDRAMTFEVRTETSELRADQRRPQPIAAAAPEDLRALVSTANDDGWHLSSPSPHHPELADSLRVLHAALLETGDEFGHRVFYESLRLGAAFHRLGAGELERTLDHVVLLKILPRIHGARRRAEPVLRRLRSFAFDPDQSISEEYVPPEDAAPRLPLSARKIERMLHAVEVNQFVSFTE